MAEIPTGQGPVVEWTVRAGYGSLAVESTHESLDEAEQVYADRAAERPDGIELRRTATWILRTQGAPPPPINVISLPKKVV